MPYPAPTDTARLTLPDRFHTMVLDINDQLGWQHDVLALELWLMAQRVTGGATVATAPYAMGHREIHRRAATHAIHCSRVLLRAALATAAVDPSTVADALQTLDQIAHLLDP